MCTYVMDYIVSFVFQIITQFKEQGLNTELYNKNREMGETFSIVPTSAIRSVISFVVFSF